MEEEPMYNNASMQACTAACYGSFLETRGFLEAEGVTQSTDPSDLLEPTYTCSSTESAPSPGPLNPRGSSSDPRLSIDTPLLHADGGGSVARRNERERKRVRMVNMGFAKLRQYVPLATRGKRLSKVETLRSAIDYIRQLRQLLVYHQQYGEDPTPDCYHFYNIPHHAPHHPMMMSSMNPYHQFSGPAIGGYGVIGPAYAAEPTMDHGSVQSSWSVSSESPSPGLDTETASSPNGYGLLETETQVPCWTV